MKLHKISKALIAVGISALTVIGSAPSMASSIGSVASDPSIGEDPVQGVQTEYAETGVGSSDTDVYLTVDNSDVVVMVPTTVVLSGTPTDDGKYVGEYSVKVQGDMAGSEILTVEPQEDTVSLNQKGKSSVDASIEQQQTVFTADDLKNETTTTGTVTATGLTAGSWSANTAFNISIGQNREVLAKLASETFIPDIGARYAESPTNTLSTSNIYQSKQYKFCWNTAEYNVIPLSELGLQAGDEITIKNSSDNHTYYVLTGDSNWKELSRTSVLAGKETTYEIPETAFAMSIAIADWSQAMSQDDFDLQNLFISKDGQDIKYLDVLAKYAQENKKYSPDSNPRMTLGHNVDSFDDTKIFIEEYGMRYLDIDITFTKDNIPLITHDGPDVEGTINPLEYTYEELKEMGHNYDNLLDCLDYYEGYDDLYLAYDLKQNCAEQFIEVVMPELESRNMLNRTTITSSSFNELKKIHDYDDSIGLRLFSGQANGYTDEMIEEFLSLKSDTNTLDIVTSYKTYKPEYAEQFDYVTIGNYISGMSNISDLVNLYNTTADNVRAHFTLRTPTNLKLVYDRYKAYFS